MKAYRLDTDKECKPQPIVDDETAFIRRVQLMISRGNKDCESIMDRAYKGTTIFDPTTREYVFKQTTKYKNALILVKLLIAQNEL